MKPARIGIVGAGNVGAASAAAIAAEGLGTVCLYDAVCDLAAGKAMDISQASSFFHGESEVVGCESLGELAGCDVLILAAGAPRRAGMVRRDLLEENLGILLSVCTELIPLCPASRILVVTNPVNILTWILARRWPEAAIFGLGCCLDAVRFRHFLARSAGVSVDSVSATVIGTHDDRMIPLVRHATIGGGPADRTLTAPQLAAVVSDTRQAGARIVGKLKTRGSHYTASWCVSELVRSITRDRREVFPVCIPCHGAYGYQDTCLSLPAIVGAAGVEGVVELALNHEERSALDVCAAEVARSA